MIGTIVVGALQVNTYFIIDKDTNQGIIIDPGSESNKILKKIKENNWEIKLILLTHGHFDHIGAAMELKEKLECDIVIHKEGKEYLENSKRNLSSVFGNDPIEFTADKYITGTEEEIKEITSKLPKALSFQALYSPGHTTDSIVFYFPNYKVAFVGDVIFRESIGRTDLAGGSSKVLMESIKSQVFTLPEDTILYPGHGPLTTVKYEKQYNPHFNWDF